MKQTLKIITLLLAVALMAQCQPKSKTETTTDVWSAAEEIVKNIGTITFADTVFNVLDFSAIADGKTPATKAINDAIKACSAAGGGTVLVPAGDYFTAAIHLEDNVNLKIDEGATLFFSTETKDYLPLVKSSWEGVFCYNYSPLIYAHGKTNIGLTGKGRIHGMSENENWWKMKGKKEFGWKEGIPCQGDEEGRPLLMKYNKELTPIEERQMGEGHWLRPHFVQFLECKNVLIQDITIEESPFWVVHPILCENVIVRGITINSLGPNNDGCDPESCKNVLIEDCLFNTGDDCIALKSGRDWDGRAMNKPIENVVIRNCVMKNGHGGVVLGSEISSGCKNIFVENCKMSSPELDRAIRIKTNNNRGGVTEKFYVRNIEVGEVKEAVVRINCAYDSKEGQGNHNPLVKDVYIENVHSKKAQHALKFNGLSDTVSVQNIHITNCKFDGVEKENIIKNVEGLHLTEVYINGNLAE